MMVGVDMETTGITAVTGAAIETVMFDTYFHFKHVNEETVAGQAAFSFFDKSLIFEPIARLDCGLGNIVICDASVDQIHADVSLPLN
jgi:hypothetical protein